MKFDDFLARRVKEAPAPTPTNQISDPKRLLSSRSSKSNHVIIVENPETGLYEYKTLLDDGTVGELRH